ncbi:MAG: AAA family ATPase [Mycobacterium sp.]
MPERDPADSQSAADGQRVSVSGDLCPTRGRDLEMASLTEHLAALGDGKGLVVLVEGAPGAGKTRMLNEAGAAASAHGYRVLRGAADPDAQMVPFAALLQAVTSGPDPLLDASALTLLRAGPDLRFWLLLEVQDRLEQAANSGPLVICIDDVQWCDPETLVALRTLPRRLSTHAVLWIVGVRTADLTPAVRETLGRLREEGARSLRLGPLADAAVDAMVHDLLGAAAPDWSVLAAARRAQGRPLLIAELLRGLCDEGSIRTRGGVARLVGDHLPARFGDLVRHRLARLSDTGRNIVLMGSVLGRSFSVGEVAELLDRQDVDLFDAIQEALDSDFLAVDGQRISFRHDLIRETVERGLPAVERRSLRRLSIDMQLRRGVPLAEVAAQIADTATVDDDIAITLLRRAATELAASAPSSAADLSLRALALSPVGSPQHSTLVAETIPLLWQDGRAVEAKALADNALEGLLEPEVEARVRQGLAMLSSQLSFSEAVRQIRTALALREVSEAVRAELTAMLALNLGMMGELEQTEPAVIEAMRFARLHDDQEAETLTLAMSSVVEFYRPDWTAAIARAEQSRALAANLNFVDRLWVSESWRALLLTAMGRCEDALEVSRSGLDEAQRRDQAAGVRMWTMVRSRILLDAGRLADARTEAETLTEMTDGLGSGNYGDATVGYTLARVALWTGDGAGIRRAGMDAERMRGDDAVLMRGVGSWIACLIAEAAGDDEAAMRATGEAVDRFGRPGPVFASPLDPTDTATFVRIALRAGRRDRARRAVLAAEHRAECNPGFPILSASAAHARGLFDEDVDSVLRAVAEFQDSERVIPWASAAEDAGRMLLASDVSQAVEHLQKALDLYDSAGDDRDGDRVRARLRSYGVLRRRTTPRADAQGWHALTPSELQVVAQIATGLTNREAAQRLQLSPHTVNTHLRHIFAKLHISTRVELTRIALAHTVDE